MSSATHRNMPRHLGRGEGPTSSVIFQNVRVYDGKSREAGPPCNVVIDGNRITKISTSAIPHASGSQTISGGGRVLMPGLIDAHWHALICSMTPAELLSADIGYVHLVAGREAGRTLMRGFTTVRDLGGPAFALKRIIDEGKIAGPRFFPSGALISQTSGHGDFRSRGEIPTQPNGCLCHSDAVGMTAIADGVPNVLRVVREQLMLGATQIKLCAGGGVSSPHDPLDVTQFSIEELRAAVSAAEDWGTYVTVHVYTPRAMRRAIEAGVRCIEHGHLMDDSTAELLAEKGVWACVQPFLDDEDAVPVQGENRKKQLQIVEGTDRAYRLAKKHGFKLAFGTDTLFSPKLLLRQGAQLAKLSRWFSSHEVLRMATSTNAALLEMCGDRNNYGGKLGVVEEGALADVLLVDGNPLENLELIADPDKNFLVIVKDGIVFKNLLR